MFDIDRWQEIFDTIAKNKLRTFLTGLSVASGIFILVILLGFGRGMENGIRKEFEGDATNLIFVWAQRTTKEYKGMNPGRQINLKNENRLAAGGLWCSVEGVVRLSRVESDSIACRLKVQAADYLRRNSQTHP